MLNGPQNNKLLAKLSRALDVYEPFVFEHVTHLDYTMYETDQRLESIPDATYFESPYERANGFQWGGEGMYCWFLTQFTPSADLQGKNLYLYPELGGYEAMLWCNNHPYGTYATKIVVTHHGNHYCDCICQNAQSGVPIQIAIEFYAGHYVIGEQPFEERPHSDYKYTARQLSICTKRQDVVDFILDLRVLLQLADKLPETSFRRAEILNVLTDVHSALCYDPRIVPESSWRKSLSNARHIMAPALTCRNGDSAPIAWVVGHSHIDTAWLWPIEETIKKIARTASNQFSLMDQYPEYCFIQSAAYHTYLMEQHYPQIFDELQRRTQDGRFELNGAVWVECDCNIPSGESLIRQFLWGTRYMQDRFGISQSVFWLPDTFGYSAALPQIMQGFNVKTFLTTKLAWNDTNRFPYESFVWKGIDGSTVTAHFFVIDTWPDPAGLLDRIEGTDYKDHISQKQALNGRLVAFGYGDGGGGPQFEMIEVARRLQNLEGCPRVQYTTAEKFAAILEEASPTLPVYDGELYLELHRGTLTSKQQIKKNNRVAENLLRMLELTICKNAIKNGIPADGQPVAPLWNTLLVNQFHDILPGSCIGAANDRSLHDMAQMLQTGRDWLRQQYLETNDCYTIFNPLDEPCNDVFYLPGLQGKTSSTVGVQTQTVYLTNGQPALAVYGLERPAYGSAVLRLTNEMPSSTDSSFTYDGSELITPTLRVRFDELGRITSLVTRADNIEWANGPLNTLLTAEDVSAGWDGWDIDADCLLKLQPDVQILDRKVTTNGPLEFRLHCSYQFGVSSTMEQDIIFRSDSTLVEWNTVLHWREQHRILKAAFPTNVRSKYARHEIQFGYIERPTTLNDTREQAMFERCNHRYTDLSEPSRGIALLNDCKYGISVQNGTMALTLAKGGTRPDERGDAGDYTFRYGILPHANGFNAEIPRHGMRFDRQPIVLATNAPSPAMLYTDTRNIIIETVKPCEDTQCAIIVRLYECEGSRTGQVCVHAPFVTAAEACDMSEHTISSVTLSALDPFRPFEIRTLRLYYTPSIKSCKEAPI